MKTNITVGRKGKGVCIHHAILEAGEFFILKITKI